MTARPFLIWPDKRLRMAAAPVERVDDDVRAIWQDMLDSMYAMPGVGLGAPQIGVMRALAVVDCSDGRDSPVRLANPVLVSASETMRDHEEGSPNLPNLWARLSRPESVVVRYLDETGAQTERQFDGLWSTSVQHQMDHLEGRMFFDRLSAVKRKMLLAKHAKARKRGA